MFSFILSHLFKQLKDVQVIKLDPIYEVTEKFKNLNIPHKLMKYFHNNECNKFKHTYRKDTKLNEEDATVGPLILRIPKYLPQFIYF